MSAYKKAKRLDWLRGPASPPYAEWIADRIADAVTANELQPDDRLPPQRDVARSLGVDLSTVTRGYREAQRRGLILGQSGRGTFVAGRAKVRTINLAVNLPPPLPPDLAREALQVAANITRGRGSALLEYGLVPHRALDAAEAWLRRSRVSPIERERIVITAGAQQALATVAAALHRDHRIVLVEEVTFSNFREVAAMFGLELVPVKMDADGVDPAALVKQARKHRATAVYLMPDMQNPTGITMPESRRDAVAEAIAAAKLLLIEDSIYAVLFSKIQLPLASRIPERAVYITSLSKTVAPGLRTGYIHAPRELVPRLQSALRTLIFTPALAGAEIASAWIETGLADRIVAMRRQTMQSRHRVARAMLAGTFDVSPAMSYHLWLRLQRPESELVQAAMQRGLIVNAGSAFAVGAHPPAVRVCIAAAADLEETREAAAILRDVAREVSEPKTM
jgi:DNA-binding transcriptional MocR family regulator